jgi:peptidyl-prolyl cis-trans isomerase D
MFDFVRKHTRWMQLVLFLLIVPSFVLFGIQGYDRMQDAGGTVAKVDGKEITQQEWDNAHKAQVDRMREQVPNLDAKLLDSPAAKYAALEELVRDRVLAAAVEQSHLVVGDQRVARELQSNELIAALRKPDGTLDIQRYQQLLAARGMSPAMFENQVRNDIALRQVLAGVGQSAFTPPAQAGVAIGSYFERREAQIARFDTNSFKDKVQPTDAELQAFYKENPQLFQAPEQASIEYVMLDLASIEKGITLNEADLKTYYEQNAGRIGGQEERRASHILVAVPKGAPPEEKAKAKAKADELLAQVQKNPDSFAEVAKKNSQDAGSAPQGGDLDFFARGAMTKPFEDAVFAMKQKGEIAGPVESEFGYHIIRLTDVKTPKQRTFEEMRPQLEADLKKQQAQKKYAEAAEAFSNGVYEQSDSLKPVADKLKLEIRTAAGVTRTPQPGASGPLANPKFLGALFAPDTVERKRNTEAVEVGPSQLVSGRIVQYAAARTRPFEEVKAQVRERVVAAKAAELARKEGEAKLAAWKANPAAAEFPAPIIVSRQEAAKQPRQVVEAALRAEPAKLPALVGVDLGPEGYAIVKVNKMLPRDTPAPQQAQQEVQQYTQAWARTETLAYYNLLKDRYKAEILVPRPKDTVTQ